MSPSTLRRGAFETDADEITASHRLLARIPEAQIWFRWVGVPYTRRFSPRPAGPTGREIAAQGI